MGYRNCFRALLPVISASALAVAGADALAQPAGKAGVAAAVNVQTQGTPPASPTRTLEIGNDVFQQERITTDPQGQAQMLFLDGSAFTIGPNAEVTLDEFVYDPSADTGKLAISAGKGVMRFVGGKLSKKDAVLIKTPTATLGIRGGIALVDVQPGGATQATLLFGQELSVQSANGAVQRITRPGFTTAVANKESAPTTPVKATAEQLGKSLSQLSGHSATTGGAKAAPTDSKVAASAVSTVNSKPVTTAVEAKPATSAATTTSKSTTSTATATQSSTITASASQTQNKAVAAKTTVTVAAYNVAPDPALNSAIPGARGAVGGNLSGAQVSRQFLITGSGSDGVATRGLQASIVINGQGAAQSSLVMVTTSEVISTNNGKTNFLGSVERGSARIDSTQGATRIGAFTTTKNDTTFSGSKLPTSFVSATSDANGNSAPASDTTLMPLARTDYTFKQTSTKITTPTGVGTTSTTQTLGGYATGVVDTRRADGTRADPTILGTGNLNGGGAGPGDPGGAQISTNTSNHRVGAQFTLTDGGSDVDGRRRTGPTSTGTLRFGSVDGQNNARSAFIDNDRFAAGEAIAPGTTGQVASSFNGGPLRAANDPLGATDLYLVSSALVQTSNVLPAGVSFCQCDFAKWGYWGGQLASGPDNAIRRDRIHLGTWVAGPMARTSDMPQTGVASYTGHAIGTVVNGSSEYIAGGGFANTFDFARKQGTLTISNFDGLNMSGTMASSNGRDYGGALTVTGRDGLAGSAQGSFFSGKGDPARETGGQFAVKANTTLPSRYAVGGIFVGKKR